MASAESAATRFVSRKRCMATDHARLAIPCEFYSWIGIAGGEIASMNGPFQQTSLAKAHTMLARLRESIAVIFLFTCDDIESRNGLS